MRSLAVLVAGLPVLWFAWHAAERAYQIARQDHKERAALKLAKEWAPFARAYATVAGMSAMCTQAPPWKRQENISRNVYILGVKHEVSQVSRG